MSKQKLIIEGMFQIVNKNGEDVPFILNTAQSRLDNELTGRDIIPKARQLGISQYFLGRYLADCLSVRNTRAVVISHDKESTERQLARVHYMLSNIRGPKAVVSNSSKGEIVFPKTNSTFFIGTAGSRKFGRGDMITRLHCSEVAFWEDPKALVSGLFQAVPRDTGEIAIESTGNGTGNWYHRQCMRAYEGKSRFKIHFFNWLHAPEYNVPLSADERVKVLLGLREDLEEEKLLKFGLTPDQLMFRREKLDELDYDLSLFRQEYPITIDECFQNSGSGFFSVIKYEPTDEWVKIPDRQNFWALRDDYKHRQSKYAIGVDVGGGVRKNRSVIQVIDVWKWKQVGEYVADNVSPDRLAKEVIEIGRFYRDAFVTVETNNHGAVTLLKLIEGFPLEHIGGYPQYLLYMNDKTTDTLLSYGYKTTQRTRPIIIGGLRKEFIEGFLIHSPTTKDELSTFVENDEGRLEASEGCFDDRVLALAVGVEGARTCPYIYEQERYKRMQQEAKNPWDLDVIIKELRAKHAERTGGDFPIPRQDDEYGNTLYH